MRLARSASKYSNFLMFTTCEGMSLNVFIIVCYLLQGGFVICFVVCLFACLFICLSVFVITLKLVTTHLSEGFYVGRT